MKIQSIVRHWRIAWATTMAIVFGIVIVYALKQIGF